MPQVPHTTSPPHDDTSEVDVANGQSALSRRPDPTSASVLPAPCAVSSSRQVSHARSSGATATRSERVLTHHAPKAESAVTTRSTRRCPQTRKPSTEVVQPMDEATEDASIFAPIDDQVFDREEELRLDDEVMNFQWFSSVSWDASQSSGKRNIPCSGPSCATALRPQPQSQHGWLLLFSTWLLLGRPAQNVSDVNCAHFPAGPSTGQANAMQPPFLRRAPKPRQNKPRPGSAK